MQKIEVGGWLALLQNVDFRRLFAAQLTSLFGTGLTTIALALFAYDLAAENAGQVLGYALALKMLVYVGFSPIAAVWVEKIPRRQLLITLDILRAAVVFMLPFVSQLWQIYSLIFLLNLCSAAFTPAFQSVIPQLVKDEQQYTKALSLSRLAYDLENILSPSLAAMLLLVTSYSDFFTLNALTFILSAGLIAQAKLPALQSNQGDIPFTQRLTQGLRIFVHTPRLRSLMMINLAVAAVMAMQIVNTVVYVRVQLALSEQALVLVYLSLGVGSVVGALLLPTLIERFKVRTLMLTAGLLGSLLLAVVTLGPQLSELVLLYGLMGCSLAIVQTPTGNILKSSCIEEHRAAVFATQFSVSHAGFLVFYPLAGVLSAQYGVVISYLLMAVIAVCALVGAAYLWPINDRLSLVHRHKAVHHDHWHTHGDDGYLEKRSAKEASAEDIAAGDGHHNDHTHAVHPGAEPHKHPHQHQEVEHEHRFVIDNNHLTWPR